VTREEQPAVTLLERINGPEDLRELSQDQLAILAAEIRDVLVETVTRTSGHLGPNLGVVELTIALHRVFDSPKDKLIFDTGHQSYVHKLLTGRFKDFHTLRQVGGLSRPSPSMTWWRTPTHRRPCPTPTAWPRPTGCAASTTAPSSRSSGTAR
jgi:hypothetical protein